MAEPFVMDTDLSAGSRQVWILNRDTQPWVEDFRGDKIIVPPNEKKELKMPFLEARAFLAQAKPPAVMNSQGKYIIRPKALYTAELTDPEKKGTVNEIIEKNTKDADKALSNKCMICNKTMASDFALKVHMSNMHEGAQQSEGPAA